MLLDTIRGNKRKVCNKLKARKEKADRRIFKATKEI